MTSVPHPLLSLCLRRKSFFPGYQITSYPRFHWIVTWIWIHLKYIQLKNNIQSFNHCPAASLLTLIIMVQGCVEILERLIGVYMWNPNFLSSVAWHLIDCLDESWYLPFGGVCLTGHFSISGPRMKVSLIGENEWWDWFSASERDVIFILNCVIIFQLGKGRCYFKFMNFHATIYHFVSVEA